MTPPEPRTVASWFGPIRVGPDHARYRPREKLRGRARRHRALLREAERFCVDPNGGYDFGHWHVDWRGYGNLSWRERRAHVAALVVMFRRLVAQTSGWTRAHQCWLQLDAWDGSNDAVFLHTPNPNADDFPYDFAGVAWDAPVPERLRELVTEPGWQFGRLDEPSTHFLVRPRPAA
jgi:hypothetical protein